MTKYFSLIVLWGAISSCSLSGEQTTQEVALQSAISFPPAYSKTITFNKPKMLGTAPQAAQAIQEESDLIKNSLVYIESYVENNEISDTRKNINRDTDAIAKDKMYHIHMLGWDGTQGVTDTAEAVRDHLFRRLVYFTVKFHGKADGPFSLEDWLRSLGIDEVEG